MILPRWTLQNSREAREMGFDVGIKGHGGNGMVLHIYPTDSRFNGEEDMLQRIRANRHRSYLCDKALTIHGTRCTDDFEVETLHALVPDTSAGSPATDYEMQGDECWIRKGNILIHIQCDKGVEVGLHAHSENTQIVDRCLLSFEKARQIIDKENKDE